MRRILLICVLLTMRKLLLIVVSPAVEFPSISDGEAVAEPADDLGYLLFLAVLEWRYFDFDWFTEARFEEWRRSLTILAFMSALAKSVVAHGQYLTVPRQEQHMVEAARNLFHCR